MRVYIATFDDEGLIKPAPRVDECDGEDPLGRESSNLKWQKAARSSAGTNTYAPPVLTLTRTGEASQILCPACRGQRARRRGLWRLPIRAFPCISCYFSPSLTVFLERNVEKQQW